MRKLMDILEDAKDGNLPTYEECFWSMLSLETLRLHEFISLKNAVEDECNTEELMKKHKESFKRTNDAFHMEPKEYIGWNNDPSNPEYQASRRIVKLIFKNATDFINEN